jgi:putative ABC transport system permease protein
MSIRLALRRLLGSPGFTLATVATLGLGIAAATALFGLVDAVLLRPLPLRDPGRLVWIWAARTDRDRAFFSIPDFSDLAARARTLEAVAAVAPWGVNLAGADAGAPAERLLGARLSPGAFAWLGARARHGRALVAGDEAPGGRRVVVLGEALWRRRFAADPGAVGRTLVLDGDSYTVVGVLPAAFRLPNLDGDLYAPLSLDDDPRRAERGSNFLRAFARLSPGASPRQVADDLAAIARQLAAEHPDTDAKLAAPRAVPLDEELVGPWRRGLVLLLAAVGLLLLTACASFGGAQLARVAGRRDELALRLALGATRARLARELLLESALLAAAAGAVGALLSPFALDAAVALAPAGLPRIAEAAIEARALGFATALAAGCALITGVTPVLAGVRAAAAGRGGTTVLAGRGRGAREALVVGQLALSLVLLAAAGLLLRGAARLGAADPGFAARGAVALRLSLPRPRYPSAASVADFHRALVARVAEIGGVAAATSGWYPPLAGVNARTDFTVVGRAPASSADIPGAQWRFVGPGWFETLGIPVRAGRGVATSDDAAARPVALVDEALAHAFLGGRDAIGIHLRLDDGVAARDVEIVGLVGNVAHFAQGEPALPTLYLPLAQAPVSVGAALASAATLVVRAAPGAPIAALGERLRAAVASVDATVAASRPLPLDAALAAQGAPRRLALALVAALAATSLGLAAGGLGAAVAWQVSRRRREIGLRLALGGTPGRVVRAVVREATTLVVAGVGLGALAAVAAARGLAAASPVAASDLAAPDPIPFSGAAAVLLLVGLLAAWLPARRAARTDPMIVLRSE